ncbi:hypothetical protein EVAR_67985_1 [Eumeta japonica]|uniref:Uncharacterized protein n=1 Tax=Eumeta variegata TaxID=151549 RepID=A0A4C1ZSM3_EUMVA|nr:hypothetical protein EVAR_67985_1 [Eumeta japonica]
MRRNTHLYWTTTVRKPPFAYCSSLLRRQRTRDFHHTRTFNGRLYECEHFKIHDRAHHMHRSQYKQALHQKLQPAIVSSDLLRALCVARATISKRKWFQSSAVLRTQHIVEVSAERLRPNTAIFSSLAIAVASNFASSVVIHVSAVTTTIQTPQTSQARKESDAGRFRAGGVDRCGKTRVGRKLLIELEVNKFRVLVQIRHYTENDDKKEAKDKKRVNDNYDDKEGVNDSDNKNVVDYFYHNGDKRAKAGRETLPQPKRKQDQPRREHGLDRKSRQNKLTEPTPSNSKE